MIHRILIVDDNPVDLLLVSTVLQLAGHEILQAADARETIETLDRSIPDLILMDISLPDIDGLALTRHLKSDERFKAVPIVALSALAIEGMEQKAHDSGCVGFITKPLNTRGFARQIGAFLRSPPNG